LFVFDSFIPNVIDDILSRNNYNTNKIINIKYLKEQVKYLNEETKYIFLEKVASLYQEELNLSQSEIEIMKEKLLRK
jgi:hypothetical protein